MVDLDDLVVFGDIFGGKGGDDDKEKLALDEVMAQLPKQVRHIEDFRALMSVYNSLDFTAKLNKGILTDTIAQIFSDERIFFIYNAATLKVKNLRDDKTTKTKDGACFISNQRFYFRERKSNHVIEYPLSQITAVYAKTGVMGGSVTFITDYVSVEISLLGWEADPINTIRAVFDRVVAHKGNPPKESDF